MESVALPEGTYLKGYRFVGDEAEVLGQRLDAARDALADSKTEWAKRQWQMVLDQLLVQWRSLPILHDSDAQVQIIPRWTVDYTFYERDHGIGHGIGDRIYERLFREPDLQGSWDRVREARLARCQ